MFPCPLCKVSFKRNGWLRSHLKRAHGDQMDDTAIGSHISGLRLAPPQKRPPARSNDADAIPPVRRAPVPNQHHQQHQQHQQRYASASTGTGIAHVNQLLLPPPLPADLTPPASDSGIADIASIKTYFDSLNPQHSSTIITQLDQIFRQSAKLMVWLRRQTARPQPIDDFDAMHMVQRELLSKQLKLYDTASQMIAAKRDSVKFTYDDFVQRHGTEMDEDDATLDHEDYTYLESRQDRLELDGQRIVSRPTNGRWDGGGSGSGSNWSTATTTAAAATVKWCMRTQSTQTEDGGGDSRSEIRIKDGDDFEFLDSKTGKLFTNKTSPAATVTTDVSGADDEEEEEYQLMEVIEDEPFSPSEGEA